METTDRFANNRFYSARFQQLGHEWDANPALRRLRLELNRPAVAECMRDYPYAVSPWPVIISAERVAEFEHLIARLPALYLKAIRIMFGSDADAFALYLNEPAVIHEILLSTQADPRQMLNRHDVLYANGQLKLIEVNAGSTIGGWQLSWIEPQFREILASGAATARWALDYRNMVDTMFTGLFDAIARQQPGGGTGNILLLVAGAVQEEQEARLAPFGGAFVRMRPKRWPRGRMVICTDVAHVAFDGDGTVSHEGERMDAVLLLSPEGTIIDPTIQLRLTSAHLAGRVVMPDSPLYTLFGNKALMALLHEPVLAPHLDAGERALVERHIPFTARMGATSVQWRGRAWALRTLLLAHKDDFVIKKSHSLQGRDVHVGKFCGDDEWAAVVERELGAQDWLAQEYCGADTVVAPDAHGELSDWTFIWGIFDAGGRYGGAFVRGMPVNNRRGVINSATGAVEFPVFEEAAKKNKVTL
ncbi:hypothetical protein [Massilia phyllosphaerae]|uniref:hypothetical protein n=1 Tax=Massilia phyllosphaerae TaxID=3106034 RepID=UPI002B1CD5B8|nr:hypothetical protein [Massilia sp. SGZ-792]